MVQLSTCDFSISNTKNSFSTHIRCIEQTLRMKDYKESIHILQTIHRNTQFTHLYSISGKIPHRITEKNLANSKRSNRNPSNAAIKSFEPALNHPFLPATTFPTVYQFSHWFPKKRRAPWLLHTKAAFLSAAIDWFTWGSMTNDGAAQ